MRILESLTKHADVVLWTDARDWDPSLEKICTVRKLDPDRVTSADFASTSGTMHADEAIFIHIGNSWLFHSGLLRLCHRIPAVVVLHDPAIQELCRSSIHKGLLSMEIYKGEMRRWYGEEGVKMGHNFLSGRMPAYDIALAAPGFEVALGRAVAVLTHTSSAFEMVKARAYLPCYQLNLPFKPKSKIDISRNQTGPLKFVQFGYIGLNRRLEPVLEALAELSDQIDFTFDVVGNVWDPGFVNTRIAELGLRGRVQLHGFVEEGKLDKMLAEAHLVFNLRHPTLGEASGSQLRIWSAGAASVVTNQGWYGDIPENTAFQISVENEKQELQGIIRRVAQDRNLGRTIAQNGRNHLLQWHEPDLYAQEIIAVTRRFKTDARSALLARALQKTVAGDAACRKLLLKHAVPIIEDT
ncbi:MAG: glycosyltransferase [Paracoccaceae bacterium]